MMKEELELEDIPLTDEVRVVQHFPKYKKKMQFQRTSSFVFFSFFLSSLVLGRLV
jgi:hypothetical protein